MTAQNRRRIGQALATAAAAAVAVGLFAATPALADNGNHYGWYKHRPSYGYYYYPRYYYRPPPVYYYAPAPRYYWR